MPSAVTLTNPAGHKPRAASDFAAREVFALFAESGTGRGAGIVFFSRPGETGHYREYTRLYIHVHVSSECKYRELNQARRRGALGYDELIIDSAWYNHIILANV